MRPGTSWPRAAEPSRATMMRAPTINASTELVLAMLLMPSPGAYGDTHRNPPGPCMQTGVGVDQPADGRAAENPADQLGDDPVTVSHRLLRPERSGRLGSVRLESVESLVEAFDRLFVLIVTPGHGRLRNRPRRRRRGPVRSGRNLQMRPPRVKAWVQCGKILK